MPAQYPAALHRLGKVVLVVNEMISRSLDCVGAEVQCRGVRYYARFDALADQQRGADERIEDLFADSIRNEICRVENDE